MPAICRVCADGSCGTPACKDGKFSEWKCPNDPKVDCNCKLGAASPVCGVDGKNYDATCDRSCVPVPIACDGHCPCKTSGGGCVMGGCSNQLCTEGPEPVGSTCEWLEEYACYRSAKCDRQSDGKCGWTQTPELAACLKNAGGGNLRWFMSCGYPACTDDPTPFDDPKIPNCTTQKLGDACSKDGELCDGVARCGAKYICAAKQQTLCPMSRARFKQEIEYLDPAQRRAFRDQLLSLPLASYRYEHAPEAGPQLGFMIEDIEPSVAVSGDHVNMYGYLSMAVAAIQEQQQEIARLQQQLAELREQRRAPAAAMSCEP